MRGDLRLWLGGIAVALLVATGAPASAQGTARVQQSDGTVQVYNAVRMRFNGKALWITSADRRGALEIATGACSFAGQLQRCLPYAVTWHQDGRAHKIALERGTVFINLTAAAQPLHHSSEMLAPRNVLVALHTMRDTFVSIRGTLEEVKP